MLNSDYYIAQYTISPISFNFIYCILVGIIYFAFPDVRYISYGQDSFNKYIQYLCTMIVPIMSILLRIYYSEAKLQCLLKLLECENSISIVSLEPQ